MSDLRIGVAGATGALGGEVLKVLYDAPWRPGEVVPLARASTSVPMVEYGTSSVAVDDLAHESLDGMDGLILAVPLDAAEPVVEQAVRAGVPVVDCSGSQLHDLEGPLGVPWVNPEAFSSARNRDVVSLPSAPGALVASVVGPLSRAGWAHRAHATILLPASDVGRDGIDELSRQVVAMFNQGTPPRVQFPTGLAFDLLPLVGTPGSSGWTDRELRTVAEVARLTEVRCDVDLVTVPLFSGLGAVITIELDAEVPTESVISTLRDGGVEVEEAGDLRKLPRPRRVEGLPFAKVARVRRNLAGDRLHLWASMDNLRTMAVAAVSTMALLLGPERLGRED